jgi:NAD-dependent deacetylase
MKQSNLSVCTDIIINARNIVVLTGAGISTESGIADFRSKTGIYQTSPEEILSLDYFFRYPKQFYKFCFENIYRPNAEPNMGHKILAKWEKTGRVSHIITQNIDELHQKAGSKHVIEFHGTIRNATCLHCGKKYSTELMVERMNTISDFYVCSHCETTFENDRFIKPDVVLFGDTGQWFSYDGFNKITNIINQADCVMVLGSSLKVTPFASFPTYRSNGIPLINVNRGTTPYDLKANTYVIQESIGETLSLIDEKLF